MLKRGKHFNYKRKIKEQKDNGSSTETNTNIHRNAIELFDKNCHIPDILRKKSGLNLVLWLAKPPALNDYVTQIQHKNTHEHSSQRNAQTNNIIVDTTWKPQNNNKHLPPTTDTTNSDTHTNETNM